MDLAADLLTRKVSFNQRRISLNLGGLIKTFFSSHISSYVQPKTIFLQYKSIVFGWTYELKCEEKGLMYWGTSTHCTRLPQHNVGAVGYKVVAVHFICPNCKLIFFHESGKPYIVSDRVNSLCMGRREQNIISSYLVEFTDPDESLNDIGVLL